jgi:hypothetical protein
MAGAADAAVAPSRSRALTPSQERALDKLIECGASLRGDFTGRELRSAFRMLARQFHPDRHPAISQSEQARLSLLFADLRANYERLLLVVTPARTAGR